MVSEINVTCAVDDASLLQSIVTPLPTAMRVPARTFPSNVGPLRVAWEPTSQYSPTCAPSPTFCTMTVEVVEVISELGKRDLHTAVSLPDP
jgi:hypothetical protein